jgi:glycine hydroxymethyltransferase
MSVVRPGDRERVAALEFNGLLTGVHLASKDAEAVVTFTGYCGEPVGYEVYTEAEHLVDAWRALHLAGATPAGLGARDSTRQEAGLPLFGHEIDGELDVPLTGGRYPKIVAFQKPFFLGRKGALEAERRRTKRVFLLAGEGPRKVSAGWPIYDGKGAPLGHVTSTSTIRPGKTDVMQGYLEEKSVGLGDRVIVTSPSRTPRAGEAPEGRAFTVTTWDKARDYDCGK